MSAVESELPVGEPPVLEEGATIAPGYRVVELLSRGSALDVYEVWSEARLCSCVAKTVRPDRVDVSRVRHRLLKLYQSGCPLYRFGRWTGRGAELVPSGNASTDVTQTQPLSPEHA